MNSFKLLLSMRSIGGEGSWCYIDHSQHIKSPDDYRWNENRFIDETEYHELN